MPFDDVTGSRGREIVTFNVGGVRFETLRCSLKDADSCHLSSDQFLQKFYREDRREYFFDRDPDIFKAILNFLRTGELHLPTFICGPCAKTELEFWGVEEHLIERCCWISYNEWNSTQDALKRLEHDRKLNVSHDVSCDHISSWEKIRPEVWMFLNRSNYSVGAKAFGYIALFFVLLSIFSFLAETTEPFEYYKTENKAIISNTTSSTENITVTRTVLARGVRTKHPTLFVVDAVCLSYFVLEYIIRFIFSPKKLKYATSLLGIIDFLAIIPDTIEFGFYHGNADVTDEVVNFITIIRIIRVLRIFRLVRHSAGLWILVYTLKASFNELLLLMWFMGLGILLFSSLIYYLDDKEQFQSIPTGFWWALITMTTVGYGDMYPTTTLGKVVGSLCAMAGVLMIGFTIPSLVNNFMLYYRHIQFAMHLDKAEKQAKKNKKLEEKADPSYTAVDKNVPDKYETETLMKTYCHNGKIDA